MKPFAYLRDKLFLASCAAYTLNRCLLVPLSDSTFLHSYFDDLLLIPCALPVMMWVYRVTGLKTDDLHPGSRDILFHLVIWSVVCEWIGPRFVSSATADTWDVAAYAGGGVAAWIVWLQPMVKPECSTVVLVAVQEAEAK